MLEKWFKGSSPNVEKKVQEIMLKNAELENKLLQHNVELEQIKSHLRDTQLSLQLVLSSYQGLAEEVSTLFDALRSIVAPSGKNEFSFSFRKPTNSDDDNWN